jgi:ATP-binding cassette subfamily B protein
VDRAVRRRRADPAGPHAVDQFFSFAMFIYELTFPTFIMGWVFAILQRGRAAMQRIDEVLSVAPSIADRPTCADRVAARRDRVPQPVVPLRRRRARRRCATCRCTCRPAACSASSARSGRARARSRRLVPRLFEVPDGRLFLDGVDVNQIPLRVLRSAIAMVPQDAFLFSMTLAENSRVRRARGGRGAHPRSRRARPAREGRRATCRTATTRWSASAA